MLVLVVNCGSSSVKYQLFDMPKKISVAKGSIERIGEARSLLSHKSQKRDTLHKTVTAKDHKRAMQILFDALTCDSCGVLDRPDDIKAIGHRVVHGAEIFKNPALINKKVLKSIRGLSRLAPLHNPPSLAGIAGCISVLPEVKQVAVFDTAFHQTIPDKAFTYAIPYEYYKKYRIRRYGFHGTSHKYVATEAARVLKRPLSRLKLVTCHLGNGCSVAAVEKGKSVDTSMGFTPLEGLAMGTRSGDIDPAIVKFLVEKERIPVSKVIEILNKKSGLTGLSGIGNDMRDILKAKDRGDNRARLAIDVFVYRIKKYIGAYAAAMDGLDAVIFTAGIGENQGRIRQMVAGGIRGLLKKFKTRILVIPTNEELMIAEETYGLLKR
ncbi:MAG: acetate kinase [Candidatus Omnitrophica bacterium]|nr:acetate kinase [Candidatus Omnitrophota bacterium]